MKILTALVLVMASFGVHAADDCEGFFEWTPAVPKFNGTPPPDWDVDQYHFYCSADGGSTRKIGTVFGYTTSAWFTNNLTCGSNACYMAPYVKAVNVEGARSNIITAIIYDKTIKPNAVTNFVFSATEP